MYGGLMNMYDSTILKDNVCHKSSCTSTLNATNELDESNEEIPDDKDAITELNQVSLTDGTNIKKDNSLELYVESAQSTQSMQNNVMDQKEKNFTYDEVLVNLGVISALKEYQKFHINGKYIHIDIRYAQSIIRGWYGDGRDITINFIQTIIESARLYSQELINALSKGENGDIKLKLDTLTGKLQTSIQGLRALQITYAEDQVSKSKIDTIIETKITKLASNNTSKIVTMP